MARPPVRKGAAAKGGSRGKKAAPKRRRFAVRLGAAAFFLIGLLLFLTFLLFSGGFRQPAETPGVEDIAFFNGLTTRLVGEAMRGKPEESEIVLTPEDLLRLRRCIDQGLFPVRFFYPAMRVEEGMRNYDMALDGGVLDLTLPVDTGWPVLFGGVLTIRAKAVPFKAGEDFSVEVREARVGAFPVPAGLVNRIAAEEIGEQRDRRDFRRFMEAVRSIRFDEAGNLRIVYSPPVLRGSLF